MGSINSQIGTQSTVVTPNVTDGIVDNFDITLANTEYSYAFPSGTKLFWLRVREDAKLKYSFDAAASGTTYRTLPGGCIYKSPDFIDSSKTIYFQSPTAGVVLEIEYWI